MRFDFTSIYNIQYSGNDATHTTHVGRPTLLSSKSWHRPRFGGRLLLPVYLQNSLAYALTHTYTRALQSRTHTEVCYCGYRGGGGSLINKLCLFTAELLR